MTYTYTDSDFAEFEKGHYKLNLIRTDKNGTRYYEGSEPCRKCGGTGIYKWSNHYGNQEGMCYSCGGEGVRPCKVRIMTDEHSALLKKRENERLEKKRAELEVNSKENDKKLLQNIISTLLKSNEYFGSVGDKIENLDVVCKNKVRYTSHFSYKEVHMEAYTFEDSEGHKFVWHTSSFVENFNEGDIVKIKGTIKAHSEYKGEKQTVLTRCKIVQR